MMFAQRSPGFADQVQQSARFRLREKGAVPPRQRGREQPARLTGQQAFSRLDRTGLQPGMPGPGQKRHCLCGRSVWVCYLRGRHWTPVFHIPGSGPESLVEACPDCGRSLDIDQLL